MTRRLRVAIAPNLTDLRGGSGHGRAWNRLVTELGTRVDLTTRADADVQLIDGHAPPPAGVRAPMVSVVHDVRWNDPDCRDDLPVAFLATIIPGTAAAVAASTRVVVPAQFVVAQVIAEYGITVEAVRCVPWGVDTAVFAPRSHPAGGVPYVAFIGAVEPRKRIGVLRDAMTLLADRGYPHRLVLRVGPAPWTESRALLARATAELPGHPGRATVLPPLDDAGLAWMLSGATALCLPSVCEGFGLPVLEAMACGTPVVVADRGALPELVGDAGMTAEPTATAVAAALEQVLGDPGLASDLGARARIRAARLPWSATAAGYVAVLEEAADAARGPSPVPCSRPAPLRPAWLPVRAVERCPACGAPPTVGSTVLPGSGLRRCTGCRCVWADLALDPDRFDEGVPRRMPDEWNGVPVDAVADAAHRADAAAGRLAVLARSAQPPGRFVVVAADPDPLVRAARAAGWDAVGFPDVPAATEAADGARAAAVAAVHVLGSSTDVTATLRALADLVTDGGILLVEVPNWGAAGRRRDGDEWHHRRRLETVAHFDARSLRTVLGRAGLDPVHVEVHTWPCPDPTAATHPLPPFRRALRTVPARAGAPAIRIVRSAYDRVGAGDVVVATARVPVSPRDAAGPRGPGARV